MHFPTGDTPLRICMIRSTNKGISKRGRRQGAHGSWDLISRTILILIIPIQGKLSHVDCSMHSDVEKCNGAFDYCEDLLAAAAFINLPSDSKDEDTDSVCATDLYPTI